MCDGCCLLINFCVVIIIKDRWSFIVGNDYFDLISVRCCLAQKRHYYINCFSSRHSTLSINLCAVNSKQPTDYKFPFWPTKQQQQQQNKCNSSNTVNLCRDFNSFVMATLAVFERWIRLIVFFFLFLCSGLITRYEWIVFGVLLFSYAIKS